MKRSPDQLSFLEHLDEFRFRLWICVAVVALASCLTYQFVDQIIAFVVKPVGHLVFTSPPEAFVARIHLSILTGILLALPVILYQVWSFVASGLKKSESKFVIIFGPVSLVLFFLGVLFAFFAAVPFSVQFLMGYASDQLLPMITVQSYISYVGTLILAFGITFEFPLVLVFLAKIGVATPEFLTQKRRHAIVAIFVISALVTPPDVVSMLVMAVPLLILYELGVIAVRLTVKNPVMA